MRILPVTDPSFAPYGRIVTGSQVEGLLTALLDTPCPDGVVYYAKVDGLQNAPGADDVGEALYGGLPWEFGCCNGHNTKLNCLEFHRDSEFNLGSEDFVLLVARLDELENDVLDTAKVKAFYVPKGVMVELYCCTLHYAPCSADAEKGFRVLIALPDHTNDDFRSDKGKNTLDKSLWARNKWLLAHPESGEAAQGAYVGLKGVNIDIRDDLPVRGS